MRLIGQMYGKRLREKSKFAWKELEDVRSESTFVADNVKG